MAEKVQVRERLPFLSSFASFFTKTTVIIPPMSFFY